MSRGQIIAQPLLYVMALLGFALIMFFGYKAIAALVRDTSSAEEATVFNDLKTAIERVRVNYGSVRKHVLILPRQYQEVCFVGGIHGMQTWELSVAAVKIKTNAGRHLIGDSVAGGSKQNVFLKPPSQAEIIVGNINVDTGCESQAPACASNSGGDLEKAYKLRTLLLCFNNTGAIPLKLEGQGDATLIQRWNG